LFDKLPARSLCHARENLAPRRCARAGTQGGVVFTSLYSFTGVNEVNDGSASEAGLLQGSHAGGGSGNTYYTGIMSDLFRPGISQCDVHHSCAALELISTVPTDSLSTLAKLQHCKMAVELRKIQEIKAF
jgi:hypothetical protein